MSKAAKTKIYKTMVKPAGSETWTRTETDKKRLGTWERKVLRRIYGPVVELGIWSIRSNQELRELYKDVDIAAGFFLKRRWD